VTGRAHAHLIPMGALTGLYVVAVVLLVVGVFYAFNAYIQLQERGFTEPMDIPIAAIGLRRT